MLNVKGVIEIRQIPELFADIAASVGSRTSHLGNVNRYPDRRQVNIGNLCWWYVWDCTHQTRLPFTKKPAGAMIRTLESASTRNLPARIKWSSVTIDLYSPSVRN